MTSGRGLAVADFNLDGLADLAAIDLDGRLQLRLSQGGGLFRDVGYAGGPAEAIGLQSGDFDGDGDLDLLAIGAGSGLAMLMRNDGLGGFSPLGQGIGVGPGVLAFALGDIDRDGALDFVVARGDRQELLWVAGYGNGGFRGVVSLPMQRGSLPLGLVCGDFDGDGRTDVATADFGDHKVRILLGDESGLPRRQVDLLVGLNPLGLAAGDLTGDGQLDLAVACRGSNRVEVLSFHPWRGLIVAQRLPVEGSPGMPSILDYDGDGFDDLSCGIFDRFALQLFHYEDGRLASQGPRLACSGLPMSAQVGDLDGDFLPELVVPSLGSSSANLYRGRTDAPSGGRLHTVPGVARPGLVAAADLDGDGVVEVVAAGRDSTQLSIVRGSGGADTGVTLEPVTTLSMGEPVHGLLVADLDQDRRPDLVVAMEGGLQLLLNRSLDAELALVALPIDAALIAPDEGAFELGVADITGDGLVDLIVACQGSGRLVLLPGSRGEPDAIGSGFAFGAPRALQLGHGPGAVATGDFDGDGRLDIACVLRDAAAVAIIELDDEGALRSGLQIPLSADPRSLHGADFDRDGFADLVVSHDGGADLSLLHGGAEGFRITALQAGDSPRALSARDLDRDGVPDLLLASRSGTDFRLLLGDGAGGFRPASVFPGARSADSAVFADLDLDGLEDLLVGSSSCGALASFRNISRPD